MKRSSVDHIHVQQLSERLQVRLDTVVGRDLVNQSPVAAHVCQVDRCRKHLDGFDVLGKGLRLVLGEPDPGPVDGVFPETELVAVEHDPVPAHQREVLGDLLEGPLQVSGVQQRVLSITFLTSLTPMVILSYLWV